LNTEAVIEALTRFRVAALAEQPLYRNDVAAKKQVALLMQAAVGAASAHGEVRTWVHGGQIVACLLWSSRLHPLFGQEATEFVLEFDVKCPQALAWVREELGQWRTWGGEHTTGILQRRYWNLAELLYQVGLPVDGLELLGECASALGALGPSVSLPPDLSWSVCASEDVAAVVALRQRVFTQLPQYAWFAAHPAHGEAFAQRLRQELTGEHLWWVIRRNEEVLGFVGSSVVPENPLWGPRGGVEFVLDPQLHGRGVGKEAYRRTLQGLLERGCPVFKGCSSNPAVLLLAARMGRRVESFHVRSGGPHPLAHFSGWL